MTAIGRFWTRHAESAGAILSIWCAVAFHYDCAAWVPLGALAAGCWLTAGDDA